MSDLYQEVLREVEAQEMRRKRTRRQVRPPLPGEIEEIITRSVKRECIHRTSKSEIRFWPCPTCGGGKSERDSTSINPETGLWFCFRCRAKGNALTLMRGFGITPGEGWFIPDPDEIDLRAAKILLQTSRRRPASPVTSGKYPALLAYFAGRGISAETLDAYRVVSNGGECARWPLFAQDENEEWVEVNSRVRRCLNVTDDGAKQWFDPPGGPTSLLIGQHLVSPENGKRIWVFEGEIDAMSGHEIGLRNCVSIPNGANCVQAGPLLRYIPNDWDIILATDMDEAGKRCARTFYAQVGFEKIERAMLPHKDLNEWLMKKPDLTAAEVEDTIPGRKLDTSRVRRMKIGGAKQSTVRIICETPWLGLTTKLGGGLLAGQTTGILAPSGIGKTTFCNQWAIHAAWRGTKVGLISVEGDRAELDHILTKAITGVTGFAPGTVEFDGIANDRLIVSELEGHAVGWRACVEQFAEMIREGARFLVLDNLDFIMPRNGKNIDEKAQAYAALIGMAVDFGVHIVVVWQPNKVDRTRSVNSGNQKGLSQTFQDSDNYMNLNVFGKCRRVEIEKCRHSGISDGERFVYLKYDGTRRCLDVATEDEIRGSDARVPFPVASTETSGNGTRIDGSPEGGRGGGEDEMARMEATGNDHTREPRDARAEADHRSAWYARLSDCQDRRTRSADAHGCGARLETWWHR